MSSASASESDREKENSNRDFFRVSKEQQERNFRKEHVKQVSFEKWEFYRDFKPLEYDTDGYIV